MKSLLRPVVGILFLSAIPCISFAQNQSQPACAIFADHTSVTVGTTVHVSWKSINADSGAISPLGAVPVNGEADISMNSAQTIVFKGSFSGFAGVAHCALTVTASKPGTSASGSTYSNTSYSNDSYTSNGYDEDMPQYTVTQTYDTGQEYGIKKYTIDSTSFRTNPSIGTYTAPGPVIQNSANGASQPTSVNSSVTGPPTDNSSFSFSNPLGNRTIICGVKTFIGAVYLIGTPIAALMLALSGFLLIQARGNPQALSKARTILFRVLVGIALFIGSWMLAVALVNTLNTVVPNLITGITSC